MLSWNFSTKMYTVIEMFQKNNKNGGWNKSEGWKNFQKSISGAGAGIRLFGTRE